MGGRLIIPQSQSLYPLPLVGCQLHALPAIKARSCGCIDGIVRVAKTADTDKVNGNIIRSCPACREPLTEHRRRSVPWISTLIMFEILCHYHPLVSLSFVHTTQNQTEPDGVPYDYAHTVNKGQGRAERRECWTITAADGLDYINPHGQWPQLRAAIKVIGHRDIAAGGVVNLGYCLSSSPAPAGLLLDAIRGHWSIDNSLHWTLDATFREDQWRLRKDHGPQNLATLRRISHNLLKNENTLKVGIQGKRLNAGWREDYLLKVLLG